VNTGLKKERMGLAKFPKGYVSYDLAALTRNSSCFFNAGEGEAIFSAAAASSMEERIGQD